MTEVIRSLILGIVQGLTEFLPISSSGHLELINHWLGSSETLDSDLLMIVLVHFGTACSILYVFNKDIIAMVRNLHKPVNTEGRKAWMIALSMVPAAAIGLLFEETIEEIFSGTILYVCIFLVITGIVLLLTPKKVDQTVKMDYPRAMVVGIAQAIAILPGISRSGMTIASAIMLKVEKEEAARFSFLMVLPLIFGKVIMDIGSGELIISSANAASIAVAFLSSFLVGVWACKWMVSLVKRSRIHHFAYYCITLGILTILIETYA